MSQAVVVRFRPLKLITCLCGTIAVILVIIAISGTWLMMRINEDGQEVDVSDSLWQTCRMNYQDGVANPSCEDPATTDWLNAVRAFAILSLLLCVVATGFRVAGWICLDDRVPTLKLVSGVFMGSAMVSIIIALIIFPVMTLKSLPYRDNGNWFFHWAYAVAWGGIMFMIGFIILLFIPNRVERREGAPQKDKIYYVNSGSQFETNA